MKKQFYFIEDKGKIQFVIVNKGFHWFPASLLGLFSISCFLFPIFVIWFTGGPIGFGFVLTILIFWGIGIYSMRLFLWNLVGKEIFQNSNHQIVHYYDYGLFRDNTKTLKSKIPNFYYTIGDNSNGVFELGENEIFDVNKVYFLAYKIKKQLCISDFAVSFEGIEDFRKLALRFNK